MRNPRQGRELDAYVRDFIRDPQSAAEYLNAASEEGDNAAFLIALKHVLDVHGSLSELARKTGLNRANLHRMLRGNSSPRLDTLTKVLHSAGLRISIRPLERGAKPKRARQRTPARAGG
jgi:probable addiction module antidote protein